LFEIVWEKRAVLAERSSIPERKRHRLFEGNKECVGRKKHFVPERKALGETRCVLGI
jgi:hypothetical protein